MTFVIIVKIVLGLVGVVGVMLLINELASTCHSHEEKSEDSDED